MSGETRVKAGGYLVEKTTAALHGWRHLLAGDSSPAPDTPRSSRFQPSLKHPTFSSSSSTLTPQESQDPSR